MLVRGLQTSFYLVMSDVGSAFFQVQQLMLILRIHIKIQLFVQLYLSTTSADDDKNGSNELLFLKGN